MQFEIFLINPASDSNVCRIAPKMLWIYYLVIVSHFAEYCENRPVTVWKMLINVLNPVFPTMREVEKLSRIHKLDRITTKS